MSCNQRQKGARGERELRDQFREAGFLKAHRGVQFCGLQGNADVVVPELPGLYFESKLCQNTSIHAWLSKAESEAQERLPVVCWKKNHSRWLAFLYLDDFLEIIQHSDLVKSEVTK